MIKIKVLYQSENTDPIFEIDSLTEEEFKEELNSDVKERLKWIETLYTNEDKTIIVQESAINGVFKLRLILKEPLTPENAIEDSFVRLLYLLNIYPREIFDYVEEEVSEDEQ